MIRQRQPKTSDEAHLDFIRSLPCVSCGDNTATEAAHLRSGNLTYGKESTGGAQKPSDKWTNPLCGRCHREQHEGNEWQWWKAKRINPFTLAMTLHDITGNHELACIAIERHRSQIGN